MLLAAHTGLTHDGEISRPCFAVLVNRAKRGEAEEEKTQFILPDIGTGGLLEAVPPPAASCQGAPVGTSWGKEP